MKWIVLFFIAPVLLQAQKEDHIWIIGDSNTPNTTSHGGIIIDFNYAPPKATYRYREINMRTCNASISNGNGELLFYTNGCDIADRNDSILPNGDGLNPGYMHDLRCDEWESGYGGGYPNAVILPLPGSDSIYFVFHKSSIYLPGPPEDLYNNQFLYSIVHMNPQTGVGYVAEKNIEFMADALAFGETSAVKHANGTDWWLITPRRNSNQFYIFRFTADGVVDTLTQTIGGLPPPQEEGSGQNTLSPDGSLMVRYYPYHPAMLYDFDRATGQFSNYRTVAIDFGTAWAFDGGCAISPSGQYLYIAAMKRIYQFDLWANDISSTQTTVAEWDGFVGPIATNFYTCQLGPDCKIYIIAGGDTRYYHIIHSPNQPGLACNVEQRGLVLPTPSGASIPYFPNYRLGPLGSPGQPCTPTVSVSAGPAERGAGARVWPNPASTVLHVQCEAAAATPVPFVLYNAVGQVVMQYTLTGGNTDLPVEGLPEGMYYYVAGRRYAGKVVVGR